MRTWWAVARALDARQARGCGRSGQIWLLVLAVLGAPRVASCLRLRPFLAFWPPQQPCAVSAFKPFTNTSGPCTIHVS